MRKLGVDYVVDYGCLAKDELSLGKLIGLVKTRDHARAVLAKVRESGNQSPASEVVVTRLLQTPEGVQQQESSVQSLLDDAAELDAHESQCEACPANLPGQPFGCYNAISYPILRSTEEWLLSRLPDDLDSTAGSLLRSAVEDLDFDGAPIRAMRGEPQFFESREPARRVWGKLLSKWGINADQVLQMMLCLDQLQPSHCAMLALFLGVIPHDTDPAVVGDDAARAKALSEASVTAPEGDAQIQEVAVFLNALRVCGALNVGLLVDY